MHACMHYKTKKVPKKRCNSKRCGGKELMNNLTKMGTHGFRAPEKEAVNLEAQHNPWIHLQACSP